MLAGEIAEVVDLNPELSQSIGAQIRRAAEIRQRHSAVCRHELLAHCIAGERLHVQPRPREIQTGIGGVGTDDLAKRSPAVEVAQNPHSAFISHNPIRCGGIDRGYGASRALNDYCRRSKHCLLIYSGLHVVHLWNNTHAASCARRGRIC
jgi:hypothetical protein